MPLRLSDLPPHLQRKLGEDNPKEKKRHKMGAVPCDWEDPFLGKIHFHSTGECNRWIQLRQLESAGEIRNLRRQVTYQLVRTEVPKYLLEYDADSVYEERHWNTSSLFPRKRFPVWISVVEDYKGESPLTREYKQKRRLMLEVYGIKIRET